MLVLVQILDERVGSLLYKNDVSVFCGEAAQIATLRNGAESIYI